LIRIIFPPAFHLDDKPLFHHDSTHRFLGNGYSFTTKQGVYPAVPLTPAVFMEKGGNLFPDTGILILPFTGVLLIIITAFGQTEPVQQRQQ